MSRSYFTLTALLLTLFAALPLRAQVKQDPFRQENLVAWCIVPFDSQKRTPAQRAEMLDKLGIHALAYDYRAEHIASFDEELDELAKHKIQLTAWWFPTTLNDEAKLILRVLDKHHVKTQLWVTGGGADTKSPEEQKARVEAEADRIRPISLAAAKQGCSVALYNHGSWFGEPANQIAIIERLKQDKITNVGIVYNLHHGHHHLKQFKELLAQMQPYLMALNLNGMIPDGEAKGQKILPLGTGTVDVELLKIIRDSGFTGPIGILNHTDHDAEKRLLDNLEGLRWIQSQLDGKPAGKLPAYRTWSADQPPAPAAAPKANQKAALGGGQLFGTKADYHQFPLSIQCRAQLSTSEPYNILVAHHTKASGHHWELFTQAGNGRLALYMPGYEPSLVSSEVNVCDNKPHNLACVLQEDRVRLFIDEKLVADEAVHRNKQPAVEGRLAVGRLVEGGLECYGTIEFVQLLAGAADFTRAISSEPNKSLRSIDAWQFASDTPTTTPPTTASPVAAISSAPSNLQPYDANVVKQLAADALAHGKAERGVAVFASARMACLSCHKIGTPGGSVGPDLSLIGKQRTPEQIAESVLWPNQHVEDKYKVFQVLTTEGLTLQGYKASESTTELVLREPTTGKENRLSKDDLEAIRGAPSVMPEGMAAALTKEQQQDLVAFLADLGNHKALRADIAQSVLEHAQSHEAASFAYYREPLDKAARYDWQAYVNRDRIYDFYTKEANHFRTQSRFEPLLAEYPGIDGGKQGHWGNQNEGSWESDAWNLTLLTNVQGGVFRSDKLNLGRAVCVRLGDSGELSVCFDPDTLSYRALWQGGFVKFSKVRHGFINGMEADGQMLDLPDSAKRMVSEGAVKYLGYYHAGPRIVFAYRVGETEYLDAPWVDNGQFTREVAPREQHSLAATISKPTMTEAQTFTTAVKLGTAGPYAIDTIELPWDNPSKTLLYCGDHDFLPNGSALVATMQGDIWHVSGFGIREGQWSTQATWRRFASGLHHALGLRVSSDGIFVLCRDQLTRLHDLNNDGQADWYECYSNAFETSPAGHDYICGLQRDSEGNFYTASGNQGLVRISRDGSTATQIAGGFRNPDGLGIYPDGTITLPCSEGEWTPASMICAVPKNKWVAQLDQPIDLSKLPFYGYRGSQYVKLPITKPELPLVFLPRGLDNSAGGQVYIDSDRWGPLKGNMVHLSFGTGSYFVLLRDEVRGHLQGAVVPMPGQFLSGVHRGKFSPTDGQLYLSGMAGWGSYTTDRGCFQRVRYTGDKVQAPVGFHMHENGIVVNFASRLDREFCENAKEHFAQSWNYRYSSAYGSAEYSALHYGMRGHDQLRVTSAHVLPDGQSLFLELPDLQLCNQLHLQVASSSSQRFDLFATCNALDAPLDGVPGVKSERKTLTAHPLEADMNMATKRLPNPWRKTIAGARKLTIEAGKNLSYSTRELKAKAGEAIALTLINPDVVPHNWALVQPGTLQSVGAEANKLVADPEGMVRQYVPQTSDVICYTDVVDPLDQATIYFKAPAKPGRYPFLCTFPGHWMVMNGEFVVE